jgi:acyl carrier protein
MDTNTMETVKSVIAKIGKVDPAILVPDVNLVSDLRLDSVDVLDIVFEIEEQLGIKVPIGKWAESITSGSVPLEAYFTLRNFVDRLDVLKKGLTSSEA